MSTRRQLLQWAGLTAGFSVVAGAAGCGLQGGNGGGGGEGGDSGGDGGAGGGSLTIQGPAIPTLDPQVVSNGMWMTVRALIEPPVTQNDEGTDVQPGAAESWEVAPDGLTYTFKLRDATWSDGSPVTSADFVFAYERLLKPKASGAGVTLGASSYVPSMNIKNALEFQQGVVTNWDEVGIKAPDDKTLEMTLASPNIGFLMGMTHPSMCPLPKKVVEEKDAEWERPENIVTNGPFTVKSIQTNVSMEMVKNEEYWDADNVDLDAVHFRMDQGSQSTLVSFENGEVDIMPVGEPADLLRFQKDPKLKGKLKSGKPGSIIYLALMHSESDLLRDSRIRQALSLAMDRETACASVPLVTPTTSLVPQSVPGWEESVGIPEDLDKAKQLLADAGYPDGKGLPKLTILKGGSDSPIATTIIANWKKNLGIEVANDVVEAGVYVKKRMALNPAGYAGFYYGSFASELNWPKWVGSLWSPDFTKPFSLDAETYKKYLEVKENTDLDPADMTAQLEKIANEGATPEVKKFAELTEQAMNTADETKAVDAFKAAAKAREECFIFLPVGMQSYHFAVSDRVSGFHPRPTGDKYYYKTLGVK